MPKKSYSFRLDEETVIKPLQQISKKENRTVANVIETALLDFITQNKQSNAKKTIRS